MLTFYGMLLCVLLVPLLYATIVFVCLMLATLGILEVTVVIMVAGIIGLFCYLAYTDTPNPHGVRWMD